MRFFLTGLIGLIGGTAITGCHRRPTAPQARYSEPDVQQLRDEFDRMEWE